MLVRETDIQIDMFYMGPGNGCQKILRCDKAGFAEQIDCEDELNSKQNLIEELEKRVFRQFVAGKFSFDSPRQEKARLVFGLSDAELIKRAFAEDEFEREFIRRELIRRNLFDDDLYRLGIHGNESTRIQAVDLMNQKAEQYVTPKSDRAGG